jgi:hypothetical protein
VRMDVINLAVKDVEWSLARIVREPCDVSRVGARGV